MQPVAKASSGNVVTASWGVHQKMAAPEGRKKATPHRRIGIRPFNAKVLVTTIAGQKKPKKRKKKKLLHMQCRNELMHATR